MSTGKKVFFISDLHLGVDGKFSSKERELRICRWLKANVDQIEHLYLVGDIFDHWYEYKEVVPRGFIRWLGTLAELRDQGVPITAFTGNHDIWMYDYLTTELDIPIVRDPILIQHFGYDILIGHGDGLGPGDYGYKWMKKIFTNRICQWLFSRIHPNFSLWLMRKSSHTSRKYGADEGSFNREKEWLVQYCERKIQSHNYDFFVFGHRHLPIYHTLSNQKSIYVNLGDWLNFETYAILDASGIQLLYHDDENGKIYG